MSTMDKVKNVFTGQQLNQLTDLLVQQLQNIYDAEHQILDGLHKMENHACSSELKSAFSKHYKQTEGQINRLKDVAKKLQISLEGQTCKGIKGIIKEGSDLMDKEMDPTVSDAALIAAARNVEHYEISIYLTIIDIMKQLNIETTTIHKIKENLTEEQATENTLANIAKSTINPAAIK